jgi:hypothetical protein
MKTTIVRIEKHETKYEWLGYTIHMSDRSKNITCKISNAANCCEKFGVHVQNTNLSEFIGAEYQAVYITEKITNDCDLVVIVQISIHTNRGPIVIQLYNEHNGYYAHDFYIQTEYGMKIEKL